MHPNVTEQAVPAAGTAFRPPQTTLTILSLSLFPSHTGKMADKCVKCTIVVNRKGENRPGAKCQECKAEFCFSCAELPMEFCAMMKKMGKSMWKCKPCEEKCKNLQSVLESLQQDMITIKKGQEDQQAERVKVMEGLEQIKDVAKKIDSIEKVQNENVARLDAQNDAIQKNAEKMKEMEKKANDMEQRVKGLDGETVNIRQTNAVVREIREIEKREKNLIFGNIPEPTQNEAEDRKKQDEEKVDEILRELGIDVKPTKVIRVGQKGRYPRKALAIFTLVEDCERILEKAESVKLANDVFIMRDRTYNQREEARLFRLEREREENAENAGSVPTEAERGRGKRRGRPPGRGNGSVRGRGATATRAARWPRGDGRPHSRKRKNSVEDDAAKRQRTGPAANDNDTGGQSPGTGPDQTPTRSPQETDGRPATPLPMQQQPLSANAGGSNDF